MKNIYLIPTDKPSRLYKFANKLHLDDTPKEYYKKFNIHIVSDEEINEKTNPCWCVNTIKNTWNKDLIYYQGCMPKYHFRGFKKIILTDNPDLIKEGVQAIDDDFLNWFINNQNCEYVEVQDWVNYYKIFIPQEEPKQEKNKFLEKDTIAVWNESINFLENYKTDEIVDVVDSNSKIDLEASKMLKRISELNIEKELLFHKLLEICKEEK